MSSMITRSAFTQHPLLKSLLPFNLRGGGWRGEDGQRTHLLTQLVDCYLLLWVRVPVKNNSRFAAKVSRQSSRAQT